MKNEKKSAFQRLYEVNVFVQYLIVQCIFHVSSFFFREKYLCIRKLFQMVADGWLGQINYIKDVTTIKHIVFLFHLFNDPYPVWISKGLRNFLCVFGIHGGRSSPDLFIYRNVSIDQIRHLRLKSSSVYKKRKEYLG
jgi:hypothetical protein